MNEKFRWDKEVKKNEIDIDFDIDGLDGLDDADLIDVNDDAISENEIIIDFGDESVQVNSKKTEEQIVKPVIADSLDDLVKIDKKVDSDERIEDNEELKIIKQKIHEKLEIESQVENEFMKKTQQYGRDLDEDLIKKPDLSKFEIAKKQTAEEETKEIHIEEPAEEDVIIITPEDTVEKTEIKVEEPNDFIEIVSDKGEILESYISGDAKFKNISENLQACIGLATLFAKVNKLGGCFNGVTASDIVITAERECFVVNKDKIVVIDPENEYKVIKNKHCAPEILRDEAMPNEKTDIHTMAYIMFGLLFKSNPFEGSKFLNTVFYEKKDEQEYYKNPVFVYSHKDKSNAPVYGIHSILIKYWNKYYSEKIKMMFKQIFVEGVEDPDSRAEIKSIIEILAEYKQLRDESASKKEPVKKPEPKLKKDDGSVKIETEKSQQVDNSVPLLKLNVFKFEPTVKRYLNNKSIHLTPGSEIKNNIVGYENEDEELVIGKVIQNAKNKSIIGIKNLSKHTWIAKKGDVEKQFPSGKVVVLSDGIEIDFYPENSNEFKNKYTVEKIL